MNGERNWMRHLIELCERRVINPHVDRVFSFDEVAEAHRFLHAGRNVGKLPRP